MFKKWVTMMVLVCLVLSTAALASAKDGTKELQAEEERAIMEMVMEKLENKEEKENVIYVDIEGKVYSNKPGLADGVQFSKIDQEKGTFMLNGISYPVPQDWLIPDSDSTGILESGTGAYRRVKSNSGYRKVEGYVNTTSNFKIEPHDSSGEAPNTTPYLYLGCSSATGEIDAGLLYNVYHKAWTPFVNHNGTLTGWSDFKVTSGQQVFLRFYILDSNHVVLYLKQSGKDPKSYVVETRSKWDVNGRGVQVKRLTSLAQNKGHEDMTTGEYFLGSKWLNMYIATSQEMKLWEPGLTSERTLYPKNSPVVKVNTIHADYEEAVDIDYR